MSYKSSRDHSSALDFSKCIPQIIMLMTHAYMGPVIACAKIIVSSPAQICLMMSRAYKPFSYLRAKSV
eukprot:c43420_g1_i1 orf=119-322(+)